MTKKPKRLKKKDKIKDYIIKKYKNYENDEDLDSEDHWENKDDKTNEY